MKLNRRSLSSTKFNKNQLFFIYLFSDIADKTSGSGADNRPLLNQLYFVPSLSWCWSVPVKRGFGGLRGPNKVASYGTEWKKTTIKTDVY